MKIEVSSLDVQSIPGYQQRGWLSGVRALPSGELVVGTLFGTPALRKVDWREGAAPAKVEDLGLEAELGEDLLGVCGGFRLSEKGELDLVALHPGSMPQWIRKLFGKDFSAKSGQELARYLGEQTGAMGAQTTHLQWKPDGSFNVRRYKEAGMTWDLNFLGDYVFVMFPGSFAREPYLHLAPEKRETLRKDLVGNGLLHRSDDGTFWMLGSGGRLSRFQYTEHKAKPTRLKFPAFEAGGAFALSAASSTDGWLYGVGGDGLTLFRLRRNPVSFEEEIQEIWKSEKPITALVAVDREENAKLVVAVEGGALVGFAIVKPEDAEEIPPAPAPAPLGQVPGVKSVGSLTLDAARGVVWGVEGGFGAASSQPASAARAIIRITEI